MRFTKTKNTGQLKTFVKVNVSTVAVSKLVQTIRFDLIVSFLAKVERIHPEINVINYGKDGQTFMLLIERFTNASIDTVLSARTLARIVFAIRFS